MRDLGEALTVGISRGILAIIPRIVERLREVVKDVRDLDIHVEEDGVRIGYTHYFESYRQQVKAGTKKCPYFGYVDAGFIRYSTSYKTPIYDIIIDEAFLQSLKETIVRKIVEEMQR